MVYFLDDVYEQVIYTDGKVPEYQQSIVADTVPLVTAPVIVRPCTYLRYFLSVSMNRLVFSNFLVFHQRLISV